MPEITAARLAADEKLCNNERPWCYHLAAKRAMRAYEALPAYTARIRELEAAIAKLRDQLSDSEDAASYAAKEAGDRA